MSQFSYVLERATASHHRRRRRRRTDDFTSAVAFGLASRVTSANCHITDNSPLLINYGTSKCVRACSRRRTPSPPFKFHTQLHCTRRWLLKRRRRLRPRPCSAIRHHQAHLPTVYSPRLSLQRPALFHLPPPRDRQRRCTRPADARRSRCDGNTDSGQPFASLWQRCSAPAAGTIITPDAPPTLV